MIIVGGYNHPNFIIFAQPFQQGYWDKSITTPMNMHNIRLGFEDQSFKDHVLKRQANTHGKNLSPFEQQAVDQVIQKMGTEAEEPGK